MSSFKLPKLAHLCCMIKNARQFRPAHLITFNLPMNWSIDVSMRMNKLLLSISILVIPLSAGACSQGTKIADEVEKNSQDDRSTAERGPRSVAAPTGKPVRIGGDGPRFDACGSTGRILAVSGDSMAAVRNSPFDSAAEKERIRSGTNVFVCSRSLDQQWFGIVYAGPDSEGGTSVDCGVSSPVRSKQNYDGPCKSGWVASNFVKLVAG